MCNWPHRWKAATISILYYMSVQSPWVSSLPDICVVGADSVDAGLGVAGVDGPLGPDGRDRGQHRHRHHRHGLRNHGAHVGMALALGGAVWARLTAEEKGASRRRPRAGERARFSVKPQATTSFPGLRPRTRGCRPPTVFALPLIKGKGEEAFSCSNAWIASATNPSRIYTNAYL